MTTQRFEETSIYKTIGEAAQRHKRARMFYKSGKRKWRLGSWPTAGPPSSHVRFQLLLSVKSWRASLQKLWLEIQTNKQTNKQTKS